MITLYINKMLSIDSFTKTMGKYINTNKKIVLSHKTILILKKLK